MVEYQREAHIVVPADECPFCGPGKMESGWEYRPGYPSEYYYRCSCGAGESGDSYPEDGWNDDDGKPMTQWLIAEREIDDLQPTWRDEAREYLDESGEEA